MSELGDRIRYLREKLNWTQQQLCEKTGLTKVQLSRYETNDRKPDPDALKRITDALDTSSDYLLGRTQDPSPSSTTQQANDSDIYLAYLGGPPEKMDGEEAEHLKRELEMFRAFKEKRKKEKEKNNNDKK